MHPLKLSLFHISYWSNGALNRKIYYLYIPNPKPIYEETDVYNMTNVGPFSKLSRNNLRMVFQPFKWTCLACKWYIEHSISPSLW